MSLATVPSRPLTVCSVPGHHPSVAPPATSRISPHLAWLRVPRPPPRPQPLPAENARPSPGEKWRGEKFAGELVPVLGRSESGVSIRAKESRTLLPPVFCGSGWARRRLGFPCVATRRSKLTYPSSRLPPSPLLVCRRFETLRRITVVGVAGQYRRSSTSTHLASEDMSWLALRTGSRGRRLLCLGSGQDHRVVSVYVRAGRHTVRHSA